MLLVNKRFSWDIKFTLIIYYVASEKTEPMLKINCGWIILVYVHCYNFLLCKHCDFHRTCQALLRQCCPNAGLIRREPAQHPSCPNFLCAISRKKWIRCNFLYCYIIDNFTNVRTPFLQSHIVHFLDDFTCSCTFRTDLKWIIFNAVTSRFKWAVHFLTVKIGEELPYRFTIMEWISVL